MDLVHAENEDEYNTTNLADQDGKDNPDVSLVLFPIRHEVVAGPSQVQPLYDLNRGDGTHGGNAEVVHHSAEQAQQAAVKVDIPNRLQGYGVLSVKLILKVDEHDYNRDLNGGHEYHFLDHRMVLVMAGGVAGASSGDPLVHPHEGGHHEILDTPSDYGEEAGRPPSEREVYEEECALSRQELRVVGAHP